mgnify:CR=1 FL=1
MLPLDTLIAFFGIAVLLSLTPGPDNLFVLMQSAIWGRKAGMLVVLGLCTGLLGHTAAVAFGLAAVFAASPVAFTVLKLAGAAYLPTWRGRSCARRLHRKTASGPNRSSPARCIAAASS